MTPPQRRLDKRNLVGRMLRRGKKRGYADAQLRDEVAWGVSRKE